MSFSEYFTEKMAAVFDTTNQSLPIWLQVNEDTGYKVTLSGLAWMVREMDFLIWAPVSIVGALVTTFVLYPLKIAKDGLMWFVPNPVIKNVNYIHKRLTTNTRAMLKSIGLGFIIPSQQNKSILASLRKTTIYSIFIPIFMVQGFVKRIWQRIISPLHNRSKEFTTRVADLSEGTWTKALIKSTSMYWTLTMLMFILLGTLATIGLCSMMLIHAPVVGIALIAIFSIVALAGLANLMNDKKLEKNTSIGKTLSKFSGAIFDLVTFPARFLLKLTGQESQKEAAAVVVVAAVVADPNDETHGNLPTTTVITSLPASAVHVLPSKGTKNNPNNDGEKSSTEANKVPVATLAPSCSN